MFTTFPALSWSTRCLYLCRHYSSLLLFFTPRPLFASSCTSVFVPLVLTFISTASSVSFLESTRYISNSCSMIVIAVDASCLCQGGAFVSYATHNSCPLREVRSLCSHGGHLPSSGIPSIVVINVESPLNASESLVNPWFSRFTSPGSTFAFVLVLEFSVFLTTRFIPE